jgi:cell division protein FtsZ
MKSLLDKAVKKAKTSKSKSDKNIYNILESSKARIKVFGVGGAGGNTTKRLKELNLENAELIMINTDAQALAESGIDKMILIGKKLTKGLGAGSDPHTGESAAKESLEDLEKELKEADLAFITCGLGGGTGTGAAPIIAEIAKQNECLTVGIVTLPFTVEGRIRMNHALEGLTKLRKFVDTVIIIPNDKILEIAPDLPLDAAFKVADEVLSNSVKGITEMITKTGLINLDFADLKTILTRGGPAMIGVGESDTNSPAETRALQAAENALTSPLLDVDITKANRALINVSGGADMTLKEAQTVVEAVASRIDPEAHIIFGAMIQPEMPKTQIQAMIVIVGGHFPYLDGSISLTKTGITIDDDLDIEYTG